MLNIGSLQLDSPFLLGPMAGITDAPFRRICREQGASLCYTEMVSSKGLYYGDKKTETLLYMYPDEQPCAIQIFGHEPDIMAYAAEKLEERANPLLDINMGCPVPKVFKNGDGSALSKDPELAEKVMAATAGATSKPVTAKIRLGIDSSSVNVVEMAKALEAGGAAAVAVHARTREQFYSGEADWEMIKAVKQALSIPVIGNGDVRSAEDALRMMNETGCDFVMVARAALGDPWIFMRMRAAWETSARNKSTDYPPGDQTGTGFDASGRTDTTPCDQAFKAQNGREEVSLSERTGMMLRELREMTELKGEYAAVREMRKVVGWYIKGLPGSARFRAEINKIDDISEMERAIRSI